MIDIQNMHFAYRHGKPIFSDLNVTLKAGHIYGLLGKNGAGKTTLLKNITGVSRIDKGSCLFMGVDTKKRIAQTLDQIFFLPEDVWLPDTTIAVYLKIFGPMWSRFDSTLFYRCLSEFEVDPKAKIKNLSFGQKKKIAISFALATQTGLLIMDEPTNGLDIPSKSKFRKLVAELTTDDRCVILSTHQVRDLDSLIDCVILLEGQQILINKTTHEICEKLHFGNTLTPDSIQNSLYHELTPLGYAYIQSNTAHTESKLDLEILFNYAIQNPKTIQNLLNE